MNNEVETVVAVLDNSSSAGESELTSQVIDFQFKAESLVVESDKQYEEAGAFGRMLKEKMAEVSEFFAPMKKTAHEAHKQICDREKKTLAPLKNAETMLKKAMGAYALQKEKARREAEETAKRLAKEEALKKLDESIAYEKAGDEKMARVTMLDAQLADEASRNIVVTENKPQCDGVSASTDWEIESIDIGTCPDAINGVIIRPVDTSAVMKLIRASKGTIEIPGIKYKETMKMSFRR